MPLWTLDEILAATSGTASSCVVEAFSGVSIDSRDIGPGDLFVAISGDRFDGHDFVAKAIENGADAALVGATWAKTAPDHLPLIIVDDPLVGLEQMAVAARARTSAKVVAVTGSVGKTSTKEAIRLVLEAAGQTHASIKSFNNHWGVPLMLARMPAETDFGVFEVGMNHANEIRPLVKMIKPNIAVVTNVGEAHLENFESVSGIAAAKAEIFEGLTKNGTAILCADHEYLGDLKSRALASGVSDVMTFGVSSDADVRVSEVRSQDQGLDCELITGTKKIDLHVPQFGEHALLNAAAAFSVAAKLGHDQERTIQALSAFVAPVGRGEIVRLALRRGEATLLDESYNANPVSMRAALRIMQSIATSGKKIGVLGDMLELGGTSAQLHLDLAQSVLASGISQLYLVGPKMALLAEKLNGEIDVTHHETGARISDLLSEALAPNDLVMVKGSNGIGLGLVVEQLRRQYSAD